MTTVQTVGAVSREAAEWYAIDWQVIHRNVRRLQVRIVQATKVGRWNKVQALQRLLTCSYSGKVLAVRRVTENNGKKTAGVDRIIWDTPEEKIKAVHDLKRRGYQPLPLRRVYIPKKSDRKTKRPLGIPTMFDRAQQALHLLTLDPVVETTADKNSYGFRQQRSCADAIGQCFNALSRAPNTQWILEADVKNCFDKISHDWLLAHVPMDRTILQKWLKSGYMDKHVLHETTDGTPQGGIISPALANCALDGLERLLQEKFPQEKRLKSLGGKSSSVNFIRYADDFVITSKSKELLEGEVQPVVEQFLQQRGLELSPKKTVITHVEKGFDFLGQNVRRYSNGKLLITPSKKNVKTFLDGIRQTIKDARGMSAAALIEQLNPKIRGWANYHRHVVSKRTFGRVDHSILFSLWQWARKRHQNKNPHWLKPKYFGRRGDRDWTFFGETCDDQGQPNRVWLHLAKSTPIQRHVKVKGEANPYDPAYETYFENREGDHMRETFRGTRTLRYIWNEQRGLCTVCTTPITRTTGWRLHYCVPLVRGGSKSAENRLLLHPECHDTVHRQHLSVSKPRLPERGVRRA
ncbi:MAG TPA: group II intron reverse transcriptase/maturase [Candidatus Udaeobacter sp.]|nr:group II intron reverse transcriptase/maturase [Candidatus Udaeobacter sp.]